MNNENQPRFGFVNFAETWNGRMAMMGILLNISQSAKSITNELQWRGATYG